MSSKSLILVGDFETTVYDEQDSTEVWASGLCELYTENAYIFNSINATFEYLKSLKQNVIIYYHNLKFDGEFWLSYLLREKGFKNAYQKLNNEGTKVKWLDTSKMPINSVKYVISDMGQWYTLTIKLKDSTIELRDSYKLLPFKLERIGKAFKTKHQKLEMDYKGFRYAGCIITPQEKEYLQNDLFVLKEALEITFNQGHNKLTIGACCMSEYKKICKHSIENMLSFEEMFPDMTQIPLDEKIYGSANADDYIRKSYKGGWCYLVKGKENKIYTNGTTADVNSLYPSMMHSQSGNRYPVGIPYFWQGDIPQKALEEDIYFFVRVKTRFYIKKDMLPFIQIKGTFMYKGTEALETSDIYDSRTEKYYDHVYDFEDNLVEVKVELTLTKTDWILFNEHYDLVNCEILDGCWFYTQIGIFDEYIDPYKEQKQRSKGALRELAKLFLNNLYGKFATNTNSSFKVAYIKDDESLGYMIVIERNKKAGYIPVGSAITSYARNFTIRAAQKNYHGKDKRGFIYADTDSIHCDLQSNELVGVPLHDTEFCHWKLESNWDKAIFVRQKTYIEHIIKENLEPIEKPYNNIKCAGMPDKCKNLFEISMKGEQEDNERLSREEREFLFNEDGTKIIRSYEDFKVGLLVPDKLRPVRIKGGVVLKDTTYEMR